MNVLRDTTMAGARKVFLRGIVCRMEFTYVAKASLKTFHPSISAAVISQAHSQDFSGGGVRFENEDYTCKLVGGSVGMLARENF